MDSPHENDVIVLQNAGANGALLFSLLPALHPTLRVYRGTMNGALDAIDRQEAELLLVIEPDATDEQFRRLDALARSGGFKAVVLTDSTPPPSRHLKTFRAASPALGPEAEAVASDRGLDLVKLRRMVDGLRARKV